MLITLLRELILLMLTVNSVISKNKSPRSLFYPHLVLKTSYNVKNEANCERNVIYLELQYISIGA